MKISVVLPSYGQAEYLEQAIVSVLSQTYQAYEIIVVDDGSTDGSYEIAQKYIPRILLIKQINKGLAAARNTGIANATGDYVFFLDADDVMEPNCLYLIQSYGTSQNQFLGKYFPYDVIAPSIRCFDDKGNEQDTILKEEISFNDFKGGNRLAYCCAIRRSVLLECGGYSPRYDSLGGWEDMALWYDLMSRKKEFKTIQIPLVRYRIKDKSMWKEAEKNKAALWAQIVKDFPEAKDHVKS